jgi:riboflavin kinase
LSAAGKFQIYEGRQKERIEKLRFAEELSKDSGSDQPLLRLPGSESSLSKKLNIDPYPGTLNLEIIDLKDSQNFRELKLTPGVEIVPEDLSFCNAQCYSVLINGRLKGAIVFPRVKDYPENKMELIASRNIKEVLSVKEGDVLEVEIL